LVTVSIGYIFRVRTKLVVAFLVKTSKFDEKSPTP
jgi:hypothetical protein